MGSPVASACREGVRKQVADVDVAAELVREDESPPASDEPLLLEPPPDCGQDVDFPVRRLRLEGRPLSPAPSRQIRRDELREHRALPVEEGLPAGAAARPGEAGRDPLHRARLAPGLRLEHHRLPSRVHGVVDRLGGLERERHRGVAQGLTDRRAHAPARALIDRAQPFGERGQSGLRALARDGVQQGCRHGRQHRSPPPGPFRERRDG